MKFMKVGRNMETLLKETGPAQPFVLCAGERNNSIQNFYVVLDKKVIPCAMQTGFAAFDKLFKAHFAFAVSYDEALCNFYTFFQTTMYGIDVGRILGQEHQSKNSSQGSLRKNTSLTGNMFTCYICKLHHTSCSVLFRHLKFQHGLYPGRHLNCGIWMISVFFAHKTSTSGTYLEHMETVFRSRQQF